MKKLVLISLVFVFACKKETAPTTNSQPTPTPAVTNGAKIEMGFTKPGTLKVNWNYDTNGTVLDSVYTVTQAPVTILVERTGLTSDSIRVKWSSSACSTCTASPCNFTVTINNTVKQILSNDTGNVYRYYKMP